MTDTQLLAHYEKQFGKGSDYAKHMTAICLAKQAELSNLQPATTQPKPLCRAAKPAHVNVSKKPGRVVIGNKEERTSERKIKRSGQALVVLKAFIQAEPRGLTDQELSARGIGGVDGPRRRRDCRHHLGISFKTKPDPDKGVTRWSLSDIDHARQVLAAGRAVEKY